MIDSAMPSLNIGDLSIIMSRPPLFERSRVAFWDDPHISAQMLQAHLDPSHDAASRRPETIERTVDWLITHLCLRSGMSLLDLGCGPGLYCRRFAEMGLRVTGVDYSRRSIAYATAEAELLHLPITYHYYNYLELGASESFDVISLIFFDFGALTDAECLCLLPRIHRALKPGGRFVFDVRTSVDFARQEQTRTWNLQPHGGFWHDGPYLELKDTLHYPEADTILCQYAIMSDTETMRCYRIWERCFSRESICGLLEAHGFIIESIWSDLTGCSWSESSPSLAIIARKEE